MVQKNIGVVICISVLLAVILLLFVNSGVSNAFSCSNQNITLTNFSNFVCTSQWVNAPDPVYLANVNIIAKGMFINNTFSITGDSVLNVSRIINNGTSNINATLLSGSLFKNYGTIVLERPIFLNFTYFFNKGLISNKNYLNNGGYANSYNSYGEKNYGCGGESFPSSFAGSGGASISYSACDGGSTLVDGGSGESIGNEGYPTAYWNTSGSHVYSKLSNYTFNLSLLSSAGGASYNEASNAYLLRGGSGVFPLIIIARQFDNLGKITNQGQSINYSKIQNASDFLDQGIVGAGSGGILEIISQGFINNGTTNVSGGKVYFNTSMPLPYHYTANDFGNGGKGNAFFFRAGSNLLSNSIKNYSFGTEQESFGINDSNSSKVNLYSLKVAFPVIYGCDYASLYLKASGIYDNNSFSKIQPVNDDDFSLNSSDKNISFSMSGSDPISKYYNSTSLFVNNLSNDTTVNLGFKDTIPVSVSFQNTNNTNFSLQSANNTLFSGSTSLPLTFELRPGNYSLFIGNKSENYTYYLFVQRNCLGYQNITIPVGQDYYDYDSLKIPAKPLIVYKTNQSVLKVVKYVGMDSCSFNDSQLLGLDSSILQSLSAINRSLLKDGNTNYSEIINKEANYTNYVLNKYASKPKTTGNISMNQSGLNLLDYFNSGNFTKEVFQVNSKGTINLSYGSGSKIQIVVTSKPTQNILVSVSNTVVKAFAYVPSLFLGFLGGL